MVVSQAVFILVSAAMLLLVVVGGVAVIAQKKQIDLYWGKIIAGYKWYSAKK